jgi:hypothetical protein
MKLPARRRVCRASFCFEAEHHGRDMLPHVQDERKLVPPKNVLRKISHKYSNGRPQTLSK